MTKDIAVKLQKDLGLTDSDLQVFAEIASGRKYDTSKFTKADIGKVSTLINDSLDALKDGWKPKSFGKTDTAMLAKIDATVAAIAADMNNIATAADF